VNRIELLGPDAIPSLVAHLIRNARESGRDGEPFSRARSADDPPDPTQTAGRLAAAWARSHDDVLWEVCFGLWIDGSLRGHLDVHGSALPTEQHRASFGMGIERPYRRAGWGTRLLDAAIGWARARGLAWLDLGVFADNAPARALYARAGFVEVGVTADRFRIDGVSVDDIAMVLRL
jgi:GNAT superfamily N-acetyltransferase